MKFIVHEWNASAHVLREIHFDAICFCCFFFLLCSGKIRCALNAKRGSCVIGKCADIQRQPVLSFPFGPITRRLPKQLCNKNRKFIELDLPDSSAFYLAHTSVASMTPSSKSTISHLCFCRMKKTMEASRRHFLGNHCRWLLHWILCSDNFEFSYTQCHWHTTEYISRSFSGFGCSSWFWRRRSFVCLLRFNSFHCRLFSFIFLLFFFTSVSFVRYLNFASLFTLFTANSQFTVDAKGNLLPQRNIVVATHTLIIRLFKNARTAQNKGGKNKRKGRINKRQKCKSKYQTWSQLFDNIFTCETIEFVASQFEI